MKTIRPARGDDRVKIIDAHFHFSKCGHFDRIAEAAGHENSGAHLAEVYRRENIVLGIAMGEMGGERIAGVCTPRLPNFAGMKEPGTPCPPLAWCIGVESEEICSGTLARSLELYAEALKDPHCVGLKFYPGYNEISLNDPRHDPYFDLAGQFDVPVVIHTGELSGHRGLLKYSHPLNVDELACRFPKVRFVMAHYGNPWIVDATAVAMKNPNVFIDLSGLAEGNFTAEGFCSKFRGHLEQLRTWLTYLNDWDKVMYGSDWPLVNIPAYIEVIRSLVPAEHQDAVFFENARRVFPRIRALLP